MIRQRTTPRRAAIVALACLTAAGCDMFTSTDTRLARAEKRMSASDYSGAYIEIKNVLQKEPGNARAQLDMARIMLQLSDVAAADKALKQALALGVGPSEAAQLAARIQLAKGKGADLLADIDAGKLALPEPSRSIYRGEALLSLSRPDEASVAFETALKSNAKSLPVRIGLARTSLARKKADEALARIDAVLADDSTSAEAWLVKAITLAALGRAADAEQATEKARQHSAQLTLEQQARLLASLTEWKLNRGDAQGASAMHRDLDKLIGPAPIVRMLGARIMLVRKDYAGAAAELQRLVQDAPDFVPARILLGGVLLSQGNVEQADLQLTRAVENEPNNRAARQLLSKVRRQLGRPDLQESTPLSVEEREAKARQQIRRVDPRLIQAETYAKNGQKDKAIAQYELLLRSNPRSPGVLNNLAWLYHETGDARALPTARKAYELAPKVPDIADTYGWILVQAGQVDAGLPLLRAASVASDNPQIDKHYAEAQSRVRAPK